MGEGNEFGGSGGSNGRVGLGNWDLVWRRGAGLGSWGWRRRGNVELPEASKGSALAGEDDRRVKAHGDGGGCEGNSAASVTKLSNGDQGLGVEGWDNVYLAGGKWQVGQEELGRVGRIHDGAIWIVDGDGGSGYALVMNWHIDCAKVGGTTGVGDGNGGDDGNGRTNRFSSS